MSRVLRIRLTRKEKDLIKSEKRRLRRTLEREIRKTLNAILEAEEEQELFSRDPEKAEEIRQRLDVLRYKYEKLQNALADLELRGLSLKNRVVQDILSKRINSEFVSSKEKGREELETELTVYQSMLWDAEEEASALSGKEREELLKEIEYLHERIERISRALKREKERKEGTLRKEGRLS